MVSGSMAFSKDSMVGTSCGMHLGTREQASTGGEGVISGGLLGWPPFKRSFLVLRASEEKLGRKMQGQVRLYKEKRRTGKMTQSLSLSL